jgi:hypothetical protein
MRKHFIYFLLFFVGFLSLRTYSATQKTLIPEHEIAAIGLQVWRNEDSRRRKDLVRWNSGDDGVSLGIAHFTWYPKNSPRKEPGMFPKLVTFLEKNGKPLPRELGKVNLQQFYAPWADREEFLRQQNSPHVQALRRYMLNTIQLQMRFIIERLETALPLVLKNTPEDLHDHVQQQLHRMAKIPAGRYALVDFTNLAGERGLSQVLAELKGKDTSHAAIYEFTAAAKSFLVALASKKSYSKWLKGWLVRINTYPTFGQ